MSPDPVLLVEWDEQVADPLADAFLAAGYDVEIAATSTDALVLLGQHTPGIVVTRWDLTAADPLAFVRSISRFSGVPIIAIGDAGATDEVVEAFEAGVSAFVQAPAAPAVLVARADALLRLAGPRVAGEVTLIDSERDLVFDGRAGHLFRAGEVVELTATEFALLREFVADAGRVVSRDELIERLWDGRSLTPRLIDAHVSRLRAKLEADSSEPVLLQTVWGRGYRLQLA